jgi:RimJ/RimL family protein N-acetyltransferase
MTPTIFINTDRFYISQWGEEDLEPFSQLARNPKVMRYIGRGEIWNSQQVHTFIERQTTHFFRYRYGLGPIRQSSNHKLIGLAGLQPLGTTNKVEVGLWLAPEFWGHDRANELGSALLQTGFSSCGLNEIWALARPQNRASIALMKRLGLCYHSTAWGWQLGLSATDVEAHIFKIKDCDCVFTN